MMHGLLEYPDGGIESMVRTVSEGILNLNLVDHVPLGTTGESNQNGVPPPAKSSRFNVRKKSKAGVPGTHSYFSFFAGRPPYNF